MGGQTSIVVSAVNYPNALENTRALLLFFTNTHIYVAQWTPF